MHVVFLLCVVSSLFLHDVLGSSYAGNMVFQPYVVGPPGQIALSLGDTPSSCVVSWVSSLNRVSCSAKTGWPETFEVDEDIFGYNASVYYGQVSWELMAGPSDDSAQPPFAHTQLDYASIYTEGRCGTNRLIHSVMLNDCFPGRSFRYSVRTLQINRTELVPVTDWSAPLNAKIRTNDTSTPLNIAIVADINAANGSAIDAATKLTVAGQLDLAVACGDLAYDVDDNCGSVGDAFFAALQPISSRIPFHFLFGDHEVFRQADPYNNQRNGFDYEAVMARFGRATNGGQLFLAQKSLSPTLHYFSWTVGLVHFVFLQTNAYVHKAMYWLLPIQYEWLKNDLAKVDRTAFPWLIVCGHRSIYCKKTEDPECNAESKSLRYGLPIEALENGVNVADLPSGNSNDIPRVYGLEDLFREYGVNLYIGGHTHHYERSWPVYKEVPNKLDYIEPTATAYITAGIAGSVSIDRFTVPKAIWEAYRDETYRPSYGHLRVFNASHLTYYQRLSISLNDTSKQNDAFDSFTLVQSSSHQWVHKNNPSNDDTYSKTEVVGLVLSISAVCVTALAIPLIITIILWRRAEGRLQKALTDGIRF